MQQAYGTNLPFRLRLRGDMDGTFYKVRLVYTCYAFFVLVLSRACVSIVELFFEDQVCFREVLLSVIY